MLRENLNEIKCLERELKKKNKSTKKIIKKITIKKIGTKLDIKIQRKEILKDGIEEKQINQENDWKKNN